MKKLLISAAIVAGAAFGMNGQANAACGEFQMSDMNWPSATLMANVDKIILEEGCCLPNKVPECRPIVENWLQRRTGTF